MSVLAFSQAGFPRQILLSTGESAIAITPTQMDSVNNTHLHYLQARETIDTMNKVIDSCKKVFVFYEHSIGTFKDQVKDRDISIAQRNRDIILQNNLIIRQDKDLKALRFHRGLLGVLTIVFIGLSSILLVTR